MRVPTDIDLASWIKKLIKDNEIWKFYKTDDWEELRDDVLKDAHWECQHCLRKGKYTRAVMVHHINEVRKRPDLALTREFIHPITKQRIINLVALCNSCHELEHPDRFGNYRVQRGIEKFTNEERW